MCHKLTPIVLQATYLIRRLGDTCQERYISSLLMSYTEARGDLNKDSASLMISGKRRVPASIVRHYADSLSLYPSNLYSDITEYYSVLLHKDIQQLYANLCEVLAYIPKVDREIMLRATAGCTSQLQTACTLFTMMLYYAWCSDLCQYEFLPA